MYEPKTIKRILSTIAKPVLMFKTAPVVDPIVLEELAKLNQDSPAWQYRVAIGSPMLKTKISEITSVDIYVERVVRENQALMEEIEALAGVVKPVENSSNKEQPYDPEEQARSSIIAVFDFAEFHWTCQSNKEFINCDNYPLAQQEAILRRSLTQEYNERFDLLVSQTGLNKILRLKVTIAKWRNRK